MKTTLFIGQAPARPTSDHAVPGTYLHAWLHSIGISDDDIRTHCHFLALIDTFPGSAKSGHAIPTKEQIAAYNPFLIESIESTNPQVIVPVGKLAIQEIIGAKLPLTETIGKQFVIDPFGVLGHAIPCIPLSHPSGISAWNHTHKDVVSRALKLLKHELLTTPENTV